jgi:hypothetical protein
MDLVVVLSIHEHGMVPWLRKMFRGRGYPLPCHPPPSTHVWFFFKHIFGRKLMFVHKMHFLLGILSEIKRPN